MLQVLNPCVYLQPSGYLNGFRTVYPVLEAEVVQLVYERYASTQGGLVQPCLF